MAQNAKLRLFKIKVDKEPIYFSCKRTAKVERDRLREARHDSDIVIMRGPDHWKGESFNKSEQTPGRKKQGW